MNDAETKRRAFRWELAAFRLKSALLRYVELDQKAGFRRDQPRWPKGSGDDSGRWSGGAGSLAPSSNREPADRSRGKRDGHHFLPQTLWRKLPFSDQVKKVFEEAKTGSLHFVHGWDEPHARYNEATKELLERFMQRHNIQPEQMTVDQARSVVKEIHESRDPRIRNFNMKIRLREYLYRVRIRMRGNE